MGVGEGGCIGANQRWLELSGGQWDSHGHMLGGGDRKLLESSWKGYQ